MQRRLVKDAMKPETRGDEPKFMLVLLGGCYYFLSLPLFLSFWDVTFGRLFSFVYTFF